MQIIESGAQKRWCAMNVQIKIVKIIMQAEKSDIK